MDGPASWEEYRRLVLSDLATLKDGQAELIKGLSDARLDIAMLKVKSGVWGAIAGLIPASIVVGYMLVQGG